MSHTKENHIASYKGTPMENTSSSSPPIGDSFRTSIWDNHMINPSLGFCDNNNMHNASINSSTTGNMFVPSGSGLIPQGLSQFPADSGFIERAARFSSFGRENFSDLINPYVGLDGANPYARGNSTGMMQLPQRVLSGNDIKSLSGEKSPNHDVSKNVSLFSEKNEGCVVSDEAEFSGGGSVGGEPSSSIPLGSMKRKREYQGNKLGENEDVLQPPDSIAEDDTETQPKEDQKPTSTSKSNEKRGKKGSEASDSPKEEYIHVRARRGQATNSHSLAERVRREKISERMKFLQDLVPGCSKVTGKAVMLDEIINYVQSLQRQVEFLSMKLATVNPCLDFDLESVLAKDVKDSYDVDYYNAILQPRIGPSSSLGYFPDMLNMPLRPSQPELIQTFLSGNATSSDPLRRSISSQLLGMNEGYKHPSQVPDMWVEDELHNVVHMGLNSTAPLDIPQDLNGSMSQSHINPEL